MNAADGASDVLERSGTGVQVVEGGPPGLELVVREPLPGHADAERPLRILHVAEALGGGVATVLEDYIRCTPEFEHVLLAWRRPGAQTQDSLDRLVSSSIPLPAGHLARLREVRRQVRLLRPDIIHAHSSVAGALVRGGVPGNRRSIVYTPHCFAFERRDLSRGERAVLWAAEAVLSFGGRWVAAVGGHEAKLASALPGRPSVRVVPQVAPALNRTAVREPGPLRVVTVGRLLPQKDPAFFAEVVAEGLRRVPGSTWTWIGGGSPEQEEALRRAGAEVTGWISREEVLRTLEQGDVYVHTAAWEGAPMSVFEAAALGLPVVSRRIGPLEDLGLTALGERPADLAALVARISADPAARRRHHAESVALAARHSGAAQREALLQLYRETHRLSGAR